jgi:hypothetical protein
MLSSVSTIFILTLETTIAFTGSPFFHQIINSHIEKGKHLHLYDDSLEYEDDDFFEDEDADLIAQLSQNQSKDLSGSSNRQFNLGYDIILTSFIGSSGFEEVTDWEYYQTSDTNNERKVVEPSPFDPNQPRRTKEKSGSVVRIFRGELCGRLGGTIRSQGLDNRVLLKEFSGERAIALAQAELQTLGRLQSNLCADLDEGARNGEWVSSATMRYIMGRANGSTKDDDASLLKLMNILNTKKQPHVTVLGEMNLSQFFEDEGDVKNEWYRSLKVAPPKPDSLWLVYEYAGMSTVGNYAVPALKRWNNIPLQKGFWGNLVEPPALPPFSERAKYVKSILKQSLQALQKLHENDIAHRSIGRNSIILSSVGQDKQETSSPYATVRARLLIKLSDFGFSGRISDSSKDEEFQIRARTFKLNIIKGATPLESKSFAIAEDIHALGFVFIALLLTSLAEVPKAEYPVPPTDEDSLQRLLGNIFNGDMSEFREYCDAEVVWGPVVELLDTNQSAGWKLLEKMCLAREKVKENLESGQILTAESLLMSSFFKD